jgi:CHAT domain-containing protein
VVATLWQIADDGGAAFAGEFYHHLRTAPPAEALAAAQRGLLHGERFAAPFYWAGYRVIGENELGPETHNSLSAAVSRR